MATATRDRNENSTIKATQAKCPAREGNHRQQDDAAAVNYRLEGCPSFSVQAGRVPLTCADTVVTADNRALCELTSA
jgi:hypothetical protein